MPLDPMLSQILAGGDVKSALSGKKTDLPAPSSLNFQESAEAMARENLSYVSEAVDRVAEARRRLNGGR